MSASAESLDLPRRETPIPRTTKSAPCPDRHKAGAGLSAELLKRVSEIPGIAFRPTVVSLPVPMGFGSLPVPLWRDPISSKAAVSLRIFPLIEASTPA